MTDRLSLSTPRSLFIAAVFSVLSWAGGLVKIGGSVALDSWPGFFVAGFWSPLLGGLVGAVGHVASAAAAGFPFQWLHVPVALLQCLWAIAFGAIVTKINSIRGLILASVAATLLNGVVAPLLLIPLKPELAPVLRGLIPLLTAASAVNVLLSATAIYVISRSKVTRL